MLDTDWLNTSASIVQLSVFLASFFLRDLSKIRAVSKRIRKYPNKTGIFLLFKVLLSYILVIAALGALYLAYDKKEISKGHHTYLNISSNTPENVNMRDGKSKITLQLPVEPVDDFIIRVSGQIKAPEIGELASKYSNIRVYAVITALDAQDEKKGESVYVHVGRSSTLENSGFYDIGAQLGEKKKNYPTPKNYFYLRVYIPFDQTIAINDKTDHYFSKLPRGFFSEKIHISLAAK